MKFGGKLTHIKRKKKTWAKQMRKLGVSKRSYNGLCFYIRRWGIIMRMGWIGLTLAL
jgi:hypothetical protein